MAHRLFTPQAAHFTIYGLNAVKEILMPHV